MKIFDCFTFFNELDLLEFRLKLLSDHVDQFVIAESNITHSGQPKPFHFEENKTRFAPWLDKIIYLQVNQSAEGLVCTTEASYNPQKRCLEIRERPAKCIIRRRIRHG
jgi:beta-1,4-mannosyl-glycoprotein beta-1,4-N-acetylglucosaminyltransferase